MKQIHILIFALLFSSIMSAQIVKNTANTKKDTKTNYIWQDTKEVQTKRRTFQEATEYCKNLELDGLNSWEVPGFVELFSIIDTKRYNPSISKKFEYVVAKDYWISKTFGNASSKEAFVVNFTGGAFNRKKMDKLSYIRCYIK